LVVGAAALVGSGWAGEWSSATEASSLEQRAADLVAAAEENYAVRFETIASKGEAELRARWEELDEQRRRIAEAVPRVVRARAVAEPLVAGSSAAELSAKPAWVPAQVNDQIEQMAALAGGPGAEILRDRLEREARANERERSRGGF
jgi:hypothetical protein